MDARLKKKLVFGIAFVCLAFILGFYIYSGVSYKNINAKVIVEGIDDCTDSDGGENFLSLGETYGITDSNPVAAYYGDVCLSSSNLKEFYCLDNLVVNSIYNCSFKGGKCLDGQCFEEDGIEIIVCNDSDGLNYANAGSVYGQLIVGGPGVTKYDSCNSTASLIEYTCGVDNLIQQEAVPCEKYLNGSVCSSGACVLDANASLPEPEVNCTSSGNFCVANSSSCSGSLLNLSCGGSQVCCDVDPNLQNSSETCSELNGSVCSSLQYCLDGDTYASLGLSVGEVCCVNGTCEIIQTSQVDNFGDEMLSDIDETGYFPNQPCVGDSCEESEFYQTNTVCGPGEDCGPEKTFSNSNYWWFWLIGALIVIGGLVLLFFKFKKRFKGKSGLAQKPGTFPSNGTSPQLNTSQSTNARQDILQTKSLQQRQMRVNSNSQTNTSNQNFRRTP